MEKYKKRCEGKSFSTLHRCITKTFILFFFSLVRMMKESHSRMTFQNCKNGFRHQLGYTKKKIDRKQIAQISFVLFSLTIFLLFFPSSTRNCQKKKIINFRNPLNQINLQSK